MNRNPRRIRDIAKVNQDGNYKRKIKNSQEGGIDKQITYTEF